MVRPKVEVKDNGKADREKLYQKFMGFESAFVSIGVHEGAGEYDDGTSVLEVALFNEFGTRSIPERSFLRSTIDENESLINTWREELLRKIIDEDWSVEKALEAIGFRIQTLIQNKIKSNVPPPNSPATIKRKQALGVLGKEVFEGRTSTLIESGLLLRSITYQVHLEGE